MMYFKTFEKRFNTNILYIEFGKQNPRITATRVFDERSRYFATFLIAVAVCVTNDMFIDVA